MPDATLSISEGLSVGMHESLVNGRLDIAVLYNASPAPDIELTPLLEEPLFLVQRHAGKACPQRGRGRSRCGRWPALPLVIPSRPNAIRMQVETEMADLGCRPHVCAGDRRRGGHPRPGGRRRGQRRAVAQRGRHLGAAAGVYDAADRRARLRSKLSMAMSSQRPATLTQKATLELIQETCRQLLDEPLSKDCRIDVFENDTHPYTHVTRATYRFELHLSDLLLSSDCGCRPSTAPLPVQTHPHLWCRSRRVAVPTSWRAPSASSSPKPGAKPVVDGQHSRRWWRQLARTRYAKAPADGYTLLMGHIGTLAVNPSRSIRKLPYNPVKTLLRWHWVARVPNVLVVNAAVPAKNAQGTGGPGQSQTRPAELRLRRQRQRGQPRHGIPQAGDRTSACCTCRTAAPHPPSPT